MKTLTERAIEFRNRMMPLSVAGTLTGANLQKTVYEMLCAAVKDVQEPLLLDENARLRKELGQTKRKAVQAIVALYFACRQMSCHPTRRDLVKLAKRIRDL